MCEGPEVVCDVMLWAFRAQMRISMQWGRQVGSRGAMLQGVGPLRVHRGVGVFSRFVTAGSLCPMIASFCAPSPTRRWVKAFLSAVLVCTYPKTFPLALSSNYGLRSFSLPFSSCCF